MSLTHSAVSHLLLQFLFINPRRACAGVTVVILCFCVCVYVCVCICVLRTGFWSSELHTLSMANIAYCLHFKCAAFCINVTSRRYGVICSPPSSTVIFLNFAHIGTYTRGKTSQFNPSYCYSEQWLDKLAVYSRKNSSLAFLALLVHVHLRINTWSARDILRGVHVCIQTVND